MLELEIKIPISQNEFKQLRRYVVNNCFVNQVNYYYDTENLKLYKSNITCRIREKHEEYIATIKKHHFIMNREKSRRVKDISDLSLFSNYHVKYQGCLTTMRGYLVKQNGLEIVLDKNTYFDECDYEIEIEFSLKNIKKTIASIFLIRKILCIIDDENRYSSNIFRRIFLSKNKSKRFFDKKIKIKENKK